MGLIQNPDLDIIAMIIIVLIVLGTILLLMKEGIDATKITVTGAIIVAVFYLIVFSDWKTGFENNMGYEHVPESFLEALAKTINVEAIVIIFAVSIIVALTKGAGFFDFISLSIVKLTKGDPRKLIIALGGLTFFVSMFFDNLSAIILLGSLTVVITKQLDLNPRPFVLFVGINTIIGGLPTPVSSLPNIIFYNLYANSAHAATKPVNFLSFMVYMFPVAIFFFGIATAYFFFMFRKDILIEVSDEKKEQLGRINPWSGIEERKNIWKSIILLGVLFVGFLLTSIENNPIDVALVALIAAIFGVFLFRTDLKHFLEDGVEWEMIVFFVALFVLMGILTASGALAPLTEILTSVLGTGTPTVRGQILVALIIGAIGLPITGFLNGSSAALIFSYIFKTLPVGIATGLWIGFVLSGNIGGALTPLGSITILMALEILNREGDKISFLQYIVKMLPLTLAFGILSIGYSMFLIAVGW
ncbi:MAG: TRAP transporter large permease subunit [Asgard group archaeon]|nr:TRAP transporter large permease subunit [Asgard group archaeon]